MSAQTAEFRVPDPNAIEDYLGKKVSPLSLDPDLDAVLAYEWPFVERVVFLNVGAPPSKTSKSIERMIATRVTRAEIRQNRNFLQRHSGALRRIEQKYGIAPEYLASLIWTETKHGRNKGAYSVVNVFGSLLITDHPELQSALYQSYVMRSNLTPDPHLEQWFLARLASKRAWAESELRAIDQIHRLKMVDTRALRGSHSGAFGYPQFLPSSYLKWAKSFRGKPAPNLFDLEDAFASAANYLKNHGWQGSEVKSKQQALFAYNRSIRYVSGILTLAQALKKNSPRKQVRTLASESARVEKKRSGFHLIPLAEARESFDKPTAKKKLDSK